MSRGVNKVILLGAIGQDLEVRYLPNGNAVTNISLATSEQWTDKQSGQKVERTEWHRVVLFGKVAEIAGEYARKGSQIYVELSFAIVHDAAGEVIGALANARDITERFERDRAMRRRLRELEGAADAGS